MWRALRWVIWYAVNFYGDIKDEIRRVKFVRGNEERYAAAHALWTGKPNETYYYFDYYKGWCQAKTSAPLPPAPDDIVDLKFFSKHECLDLGLYHLKSIERR